jgi:hypothetical protein
MRKYTLYSEHCSIDLYGDNPADAIMRERIIPRPKHQDGERMYGVVDTPPIEVVRVIGIEDTSRLTRGDAHPIRVICECVDKKILAIEMQDTGVTIPAKIYL